ncbi:MAG: helix-turn-helix domain-containing protein [Planctomycetota bacterium]
MPRLSTSETADRLGVSRQHVLRLINAGDLKGEKVGTYWSIDVRSIEAFERRDAKTADQPKRGRPRKGSTGTE